MSSGDTRCAGLVSHYYKPSHVELAVCPLPGFISTSALSRFIKNGNQSISIMFYVWVKNMCITFIKFHEISALIFKVMDDSAMFFLRWVRDSVQKEGVLKERRILGVIFILLRTKHP